MEKESRISFTGLIKNSSSVVSWSSSWIFLDYLTTWWSSDDITKVVTWPELIFNATKSQCSTNSVLNWTPPRNLTAPTPKSGQIGQENRESGEQIRFEKLKSSILTLFGEAICLFSRFLLHGWPRFFSTGPKPILEPTDFVTDPQYELDFHQKILAATNKDSLKERFVKIKCQVQLY